MIAWDGENFKTLSTFTSRCAYNNPQDDWKTYSFNMAEGETVSSHSDCYCLDITDESTTGATIRNTGDKYNYYDIDTNILVSSYGGESTSYIMTQTIEESLDTPTVYDIDPSKYPYGIYVSTPTNTLNGQINIEFESIQSLYGVKRNHYKKGDVVTQVSTGATGEVYADTSIRLFGFTCNNCMTYTFKSISNWGPSCSPDPPSSYSAGHLQRGLKLTQGSGKYRHFIIINKKVKNNYLYIL